MTVRGRKQLPVQHPSGMMKFALLAVLCAQTVAFVALDLKSLTGKALVDYVNSAQTMFTAVHRGWSKEKIRSLLMDVKYIAPHSAELRATEANEILPSLPATFDSRTRWPDCKSNKLIYEQSTCRSGWALGAAEMISDRICIQSNGTQQPIISADDLLSCCGSSCGYGCEGGFSIEALRWWNKKGVVTGGDYNGDGCKPYPFAPCYEFCGLSDTPACSLSCQANYSIPYTKDKHFGKSAYAVAQSVGAIQTEIYKNGPVVAGLTVYEDFVDYESGVYNHTAGPPDGGHAVKIIGWGTERGLPYWLVANSWGSDWGESGFFKILRGTDLCGIESSVVAGLPRV